MRALRLELGEDYEAVTVSFDPEDTPALAREKKANYVTQYGGLKNKDAWHFLTGSQETIDALTDAVGFRYAYDEESGEFAHASAIMVATPQGRLSKYFYGVEYSARDLRLGLVDASDERIGSPVDQILLWCFHYDPVAGVYGMAIMRFLRLGGLLTVGAMATFMIVMLRRDRQAGKQRGEQA